MGVHRPKTTGVDAEKARRDKAESDRRRAQGDRQRHIESGGEDWSNNDDDSGGDEYPSSDSDASGDTFTGGNVEVSRTVPDDKSNKKDEQPTEERKKSSCKCM